MAQVWSGERLETFIFNETTIEHLHRYAIASEHVAGKIILDIACGDGFGSNLLAQHAAEVIGVDIDRETIQGASTKYRKGNLQFKEGSVEDLPLSDQTFDVVVSFETLEHTTEHEKMLSEIKRVLKPGGLLIISTPNKKHYSDIPKNANPYHLKELYESEFISLLERFFTNRHLLYQTLALSSIALTPDQTQMEFFHGSYENVYRQDSIDPVYLIAFVSDAELPLLASSLFIDRVILQTMLAETEKKVRNTFSYKIGHFILLPLKWMRGKINNL